MDARNFTFMFYGFTAAWLIVLIYVISLARRGSRLKRELENVKHLVGANENERDRAVEPRVR
jgi:CcmD family protein